MELSTYHWGKLYGRSTFDFTCGHCGKHTSGPVIAETVDLDTHVHFVRYLCCTSCKKGSIWLNSELGPDETAIVIPGNKIGISLQGLPKNINDIFEEARSCFSVNSYLAVEMLCRKILYCVAVDKGSDKKISFSESLDYLGSQGYITPPMKSWVELIRKNGNSSNHDLDNPSQNRAKSTFDFTMQLLRIVYEMDFIAKNNKVI